MELGSEFAWKDPGAPCPDNIFRYLAAYETAYTDSGRSAVRLLAGTLPPGPVLLPAYICDSVCACFPDRELVFYELTEELQIDWSDLFQKLDGRISVLYLHYFNGVIPAEAALRELRERKRALRIVTVEDTTHSLFSAPLTVGDYGVSSLRKWFPVPDGGVLYGPSLSGVPIPELATAPWPAEKRRGMELKAGYLAGAADEACNLEYRRLFAACDEALEQQTACFGLSPFSRAVLESCSVSEMTAARRRNHAFLRYALADIPWLEPVALPNTGDCPLTCPVRSKDRDAVRQYLISQKIYCAVHWPMENTPMKNTKTAHIAEEELSLPIDQRYGAVELSYLVDRLRQYRSK